jgi:hypothetical protein
MGCLKLSYYNQGEALEENPFFTERGLDKKGYAQKKRVDYYAFGSILPGRSFQPTEYAYSMNGQEKDDEITGVTGSHTTAMFWEYDTRLRRRWNIDPVNKPSESSYATFGGNPILMVDPNGDDWYESSKGKRVWHDNTSDGFSDLDGMSWTKVGGNALNSTTATGGSEQATLVLDLMGYAAGDFSDKWLAKGFLRDDGKYQVRDDHPAELFFNFMVSSFVTGQGYKDYYFGPNSEVSADLSESLLFDEAKNEFVAQLCKSDFKTEILRKPYNPMALYKEWKLEPDQKGYFATITHTLGSANFTFETYKKGGKNWTRITVTNKHTVASATGTNAIPFIMGTAYRYSRPENAGLQPYTNITQTIVIEMSTIELIRK